MNSDLLLYLFPHFTAVINGPLLIIVLALLGLIIGFVAGLFGVGGGFLLVPMMNVLLGIPMELASGSATCYIIGTSTTGFLRQIHNRNVELKVFINISLGSLTGAILGDILQNFLITNIAQGDQIAFERVSLIIFFILLLIIAAIMYFSPSESTMDQLFLQKFPIGPRISLKNAGISGLSVPGLFLIGLMGGTLTGLLGVSGGVLFVPILIFGVGLSAKIATGTSLGVVLVASVTAVIKKVLAAPGKISLSIVISLLIASAIGIQTGIKVGDRLHANRLKKYFSIVVLLAALLVLYKIIRSSI